MVNQNGLDGRGYDTSNQAPTRAVAHFQWTRQQYDKRIAGMALDSRITLVQTRAFICQVKTLRRWVIAGRPVTLVCQPETDKAVCCVDWPADYRAAHIVRAHEALVTWLNDRGQEGFGLVHATGSFGMMLAGSHGHLGQLRMLEPFNTIWWEQIISIARATPPPLPPPLPTK